MKVSLQKNTHAGSLEKLARAVLTAGDYSTAFMYADRRCRIVPLAKAHHYTLRAEILRRLGERSSAIADLTTALKLAPEDIQTNRRMLAWAAGEPRQAAARALIAVDTDAEVVEEARRVLWGSGCPAIGSIQIREDVVQGWAAWKAPDDVTMTIQSDRLPSFVAKLVPDEQDTKLAGNFGHFARFCFERPKSATTQSVNLSWCGTTFHSVTAPPNSLPLAKADDADQICKIDCEIAVIVPIYRDFPATRACLESLKRDVQNRVKTQVVLVNDATSEPRLEEYVRSHSQRRGFTVLTNDINMGFVASVNLALTRIRSGDVLLLNADTIVPRGFIDRLQAIARSDPSIGTVTPLSNNGELTSLPLPFNCNALPSTKRVHAIDRVAAGVNEGRIVDIPNGIGFCLLLTRRCLDAVGFLSETFHRGYLEDVDFCLRARERGFRNVCATSVYVGHRGARSFLGDKRALVVRNLESLETRFPNYRRECALFMIADPLRPARIAIERKLRPKRRYARLIVANAGSMQVVVQQRVTSLRAARKSALVMSVSTVEVKLQAAAGDFPQSISFQRHDPAARNELRDYLQMVQFDRVEIADPTKLPFDLVDFLFNLKRPIDLLVANGALMCPRGTLIQPDGRLCRSLESKNTVCDCCAGVAKTVGGAPSLNQWREYWAEKVDRVDRILAPCRHAEAFVSHCFPNRSVSLIERSDGAHPNSRPQPKSRAANIGIIPCLETPEEFRLLQALMRMFVQRRPEMRCIVVGATIDDLALMASGNVFVSGNIALEEYAAAFRHYSVRKLFVAARQPLFGHPAVWQARQSGLPLAYFDWSFGQCRARAADLAIDPAMQSGAIASVLLRWIAEV